MSEPLRGSKWTLSFLSVPRLRSLRSLSQGLQRACLRGTGGKPTSAYLAALEQRKPLSPNVGVGFIPILKCKWIEEPNVGVGFMPILQWFKDYFLTPLLREKGGLILGGWE